MNPLRTIAATNCFSVKSRIPCTSSLWPIAGLTSRSYREGRNVYTPVEPSSTATGLQTAMDSLRVTIMSRPFAVLGLAGALLLPVQGQANHDRLPDPPQQSTNQ